MTNSIYTPALADATCKRISEGESLRAICRDPGMPSEGAVRAWARDNRDGFGARYRLARELQLDHWADVIRDIADEADRDPRDRQVRIDTRKWIMSKPAPRQVVGQFDLVTIRACLDGGFADAGERATLGAWQT